MDRVWHQYYDEGVRVSLDYGTTTLPQMFDEAVERSPQQVATYFYGAAIRYGELGRQVRQFASALASLGVKRGDRVALILPNIPLYPIAHFAAMRLGAILCPTNPLYVERELEYQLNDSQAKTVVVFDLLLPRLNKIRHNTAVEKVVVAGAQDFLPPLLRFLLKLKNRKQPPLKLNSDVFHYRDLMKARYPEAPAAQLSFDDTAIFLYTGGTTGISKGAVLTHGNLAINVLQARNWMAGFREAGEIILSVLPFFHSYGMTTALHLAVQSRSTLVLVPRFDLAEVLKRIRKHRPTIFCGVPAMYNAINRSPKVRPADVNSIRLCISGGAGLPGDVQKRFEALTGGRLVEGYGLSETSPVAVVNPLFGFRKTGSIGVPISDTDVRVVDPQTRQPLSVGEVGELAIRGPQVMQGYWNMPEETAQVLQDGWLYTGDLATQDEDGFLSIVDRKKDMIVSAGFNVYPREIEEVLAAHPKVAEVAVVGVPSKVREEVVKVFIVPAAGQEMTRAEVMQYCREKLSKYKMPKQVEFRDELPKSAIGKILKRVLLEEEAKK